jgi:uncharacterized OB-fold protein
MSDPQVSYCQECGAKVPYPKVLCDDCARLHGGSR